MHTMSFDSYDELISTIRDVLLAVAGALSDPTDATSKDKEIETGSAQAKEPLLRILSAHPRLGEKKVDSELSRAEQANLRAGGDNEDILAQLAALNKEYEETFPGLRYVVFVNGRGRGEIMEDMRRRIARRSFSAEENEAIEAMCEIAKDRARKLLAAGPAAALGR